MNNWRKRMIAGLMAFFLAGAPVLIGQAAETGGFSDVPDTAWFAEAVNWCIENDMMSGVTTASFASDAAMTRASTAEALYRAAGRPAVTHTSHFSAEAATLVEAKRNIPCHVTARNDVFFDRMLAEQFDVENRFWT